MKLETNKNLDLVFQDIALSIKRRHYWIYLAMVDTKIKYRRSFLGPFWNTISVLVLILGISFLSKHLITTNPNAFPYLTVGIIFWFYLKTSIEDTCLLFEILSPQIKNESVPYSSYIFYIFFKNIIIFIHNSILLTPILLFDVNTNFLLSLFSILIFSIIVLLLCAINTIMCAKFRDFVPIIQNTLTIFFFVTPIWWQPKTISKLIYFNPVYHLINLVRDPILNGNLSMETLLINIFFIIFLLITFLFIFSKSIKRIPLW